MSDDYRAGYVDAMTRAAVYVQDYGHHIARADVVKLQRILFRAAAVADCPDCDLDGYTTVPDKLARVEHHTTAGCTHLAVHAYGGQVVCDYCGTGLTREEWQAVVEREASQ